MRSLPKDYRLTAVRILEWTYARLAYMTSQEFARGADKDVRDKIADYLVEAGLPDPRR